LPSDGQHRYKASLRVFSRTLGAAQLQQALGEPTVSYNAGDPVSQRRADAPKRDRSQWMLESGLDEHAPLDAHIAALLDAIDARRDGFDAIRPDSEIDIFCGIFSGGGQGGFTLEPDLERRLADLALAVSFDIY
jgi:Domain of unknown function (DUF4279)